MSRPYMPPSPVPFLCSVFLSVLSLVVAFEFLRYTDTMKGSTNGLGAPSTPSVVYQRMYVSARKLLNVRIMKNLQDVLLSLLLNCTLQSTYREITILKPA